MLIDSGSMTLAWQSFWPYRTFQDERRPDRELSMRMTAWGSFAADTSGSQRLPSAAGHPQVPDEHCFISVIARAVPKSVLSRCNKRSKPGRLLRRDPQRCCPTLLPNAVAQHCCPTLLSEEFTLARSGPEIFVKVGRRLANRQTCNQCENVYGSLCSPGA
jgi:hypothetical protein